MDTTDRNRSIDADAAASPETFAEGAILAICRAGVSSHVARRTFERCRVALAAGATARMGFRHPGKADAIDAIWRERDRLFAAFGAADDKRAFLTSLPWIGPATADRLAERFGSTEDEADSGAPRTLS